MQLAITRHVIWKLCPVWAVSGGGSFGSGNLLFCRRFAHHWTSAGRLQYTAKTTAKNCMNLGLWKNKKLFSSMVSSRNVLSPDAPSLAQPGPAFISTASPEFCQPEGAFEGERRSPTDKNEPARHFISGGFGRGSAAG